MARRSSPAEDATVASSGRAPVEGTTRRAGDPAATPAGASTDVRTRQTFVFPRPPAPLRSSSSPESSSSWRARRYVRSAMPAAVDSSSLESLRVRDRTASNSSALISPSNHDPPSRTAAPAGSRGRAPTPPTQLRPGRVRRADRGRRGSGCATTRHALMRPARPATPGRHARQSSPARTQRAARHQRGRRAPVPRRSPAGSSKSSLTRPSSGDCRAAGIRPRPR